MKKKYPLTSADLKEYIQQWVCNYDKRLSTHFDLDIKSDHFGNERLLSIEGCTVKVSMNDSSSYLQFHSHFSVDIRQDMPTTNAHIMNMIDNMNLNNQEISRCTVWEATDECYNQYCFSVTIYFLSYVSFKHSITIDRMVSTSGHGKNIVDSINACDKRYLYDRDTGSR